MKKTQDDFSTWFPVLIFIIVIVISLGYNACKILENNLQDKYLEGYIAGYEDALQGKESKFEY